MLALTLKLSGKRHALRCGFLNPHSALVCVRVQHDRSGAGYGQAAHAQNHSGVVGRVRWRERALLSRSHHMASHMHSSKYHAAHGIGS
ncbi:MAG: hypothetical protein ACPIOQ_75080 [Promethearchaeia archaeon]